MLRDLVARRTFLQSSALLAASLYLPSSVKSSHKRVLILGGTNFVGPYIVEDGVARGWDVTLFNRGITNPQLFPKVRKIKGDRLNADDVKKLTTEKWDMLIDTWHRNPLAVKISAEAFKDNVSHYAYVSSISVYGGRNYQTVGLTEDAALPKLPPLPQDSSTLDYMRRKIYAENFIRQSFPSSHTIYRAHMIFGLDPATGTLNNNNINIGDRCYWMWRIDKGGNILAPGEPTDTVQYTDVRDLAAFIANSTANHTGSYNAFKTITMKEMFESLIAIRNKASTPKLVWVPASFIFASSLTSAGEVPMWVSHDEVEKGFYQMSTVKARKAGLVLRPASQTFDETKQAFYKYHSNYDFTDERNGVKLARMEKELLDRWAAKEKNDGSRLQHN